MRTLVLLDFLMDRSIAEVAVLHNISEPEAEHIIRDVLLEQGYQTKARTV